MTTGVAIALITAGGTILVALIQQAPAIIKTLLKLLKWWRRR